MFSELCSIKEKQILMVLLMKRNPRCRKVLLSVPLIHVFWLNGWTQTALLNNELFYSYSKVFHKGTGCCYQLDFMFLIKPSDSQWVSDQKAAVVLRLLGESISVSKKKQKKTKNLKNNSLKSASDQTSVRTKLPLTFFCEHFVLFPSI